MTNNNPTAWLEFSAGERISVADLCTIGRTAGNRVVIPVEGVSRRHAVIKRNPDGSYALMDMGSSNGTWVNGQRLTRPSTLDTGAVIEIGSVKMIFRVTQSTDPLTPCAEPATVRCWVLAVEATMLGCRVPSEGEGDKTYEGWSERCQRIVRKYHGISVRALQDGFMAYWPDDTGAENAATMATVLRSLRAVQGQTQEFRFAMHYGEMEMHTGISGEHRPAGAGFLFVLALQKLVRQVDAAVLITEAAAQKLGSNLPTRMLNGREMRGHGGSGRFYTLDGQRAENDIGTP